ncbi:hypothetical protein [Alkaliphilus transvaalensis]|uniref:hypothetical protein n=1 Tax=Alkaliphilus transvaalensis TaxID=114628 RepID=UPI00047B6CC6|nr:hypothetical protein [Alkaliphilus transvaalensis]
MMSKGGEVFMIKRLVLIFLVVFILVGCNANNNNLKLTDNKSYTFEPMTEDLAVKVFQEFLDAQFKEYDGDIIKKYSYQYHDKFQGTEEEKGFFNRINKHIKSAEITAISFPNNDEGTEKKEVEVDVVIEIYTDGSQEIRKYYDEVILLDDHTKWENRYRLHFSDQKGWQFQLLGQTILFN